MNRRELIKTALCGSAAAVLAGSIGSQFVSAAAPEQGTLTRTTQTLRIVQRTIEVKGRAAKVFGLLQPGGAHGLSFGAGETFDVLLLNETTEPTIIHWHGLNPPWEQDGVADAPQPLIAPQASRTFRFPVGAAGTHWMHAHTLQEQALMAAPLIVNDPSERGRDEQDVVILLHDFSFLSAEELLARLRSSSGHGAMGPMRGMDHSRMGRGMRGGPGTMPMTMDLNDIEYDAYLANDRTLDDPQVVKVETGGRVRLRIINGAAATAFTIDLGALDGKLVAVDGQDIIPVSGSSFPIAMGQRLDVRLDLPSTNEAFPVLALREGARERTGIVLAPVSAAIRKLTPEGEIAGPAIGLQFEQKLIAARPLTTKKPGRHFDVTLMGGMGGYAWGMDARSKLTVRNGERVEITMFNMSMMAHPMHLHGHHFQVVAIDDHRFSGAMRDTVHIPSHRSVTIAFDAINPGDWAFHCHHLYHMVAGMMSNVSYENSKRKQT